MKTDILKQPAAIILLTEGALLLCGVIATYGQHEAIAAVTPTAEAIERFFGGAGSFFGAAIATLLIIVNSLLAARIVTRYSASVVRSFVPMVLYTIAACATTVQTGSAIPQLTAMLLLIGASRLIHSFKRTLVFAPAFEGYFFIGIIPLLYPAALPIALISLLMMPIYERTPREWLAGIGGMVLPTVLCTWLWWLFGEQSVAVTLSEHLPTTNGSEFRIAELFTLERLSEGVLLAFMVLLILCSILSLLVADSSMRTRPKKINWHFTLIAVGALTMLFYTEPNPYFYAMFACGFAVIAHLFFARWPHIITLISYLLLIVLAIGAILF